MKMLKVEVDYMRSQTVKVEEEEVE